MPLYVYIQDPTINQVAFVKAFEEFRYCQFELERLGKCLLLDCPTCYGRQHSVHVDGNRKLYRFDKVKKYEWIHTCIFTKYCYV